jgi:hypothetical protein
MSEMRRLAESLVARRPAAFESHHTLEESIARLARVADAPATSTSLRADAGPERVLLAWARGLSAPRRATFEGRWVVHEDRVRLEGEFAPTRRTGAILKLTSVVLTALLAGCAYAILAPDVDLAARVALPITTLIAIVGFPFIAVALGSQREAEEAQIARAVRRAFAAVSPEGDKAGSPPPRGDMASA